jgi:hypothetical protein
MRTVGIFLGAVIVSFATDAILGHFLTPGFGQLLIRMYTTPPESKQWAEIWHQWHHVNLISVFVLAPIAGFAGGAFVGLLQKQHVVLVAAGAQIPHMLLVLWFDRHGWWMHSLSGVASAVGQHLLPVIAAMLGALLFHRMLKSRRRTNPAATAPTASLA